ncbi:MAG: hypothetical protein GFGODING_02073 [Flavobacteriales bacterium]|nr:hypothetical protein [Flavobacteriales bacterium]
MTGYAADGASGHGEKPNDSGRFANSYSDLATGTYLLELRTPGAIGSVRFVKE